MPEVTRERVWPGRPGYHTREECDGGYEPHIHLRSSEAIVYAKPKPPHADGERHRYRIVCLDCGEEGTVRLSIDPEAYREDTDPNLITCSRCGLSMDRSDDSRHDCEDTDAIR